MGQSCSNRRRKGIHLRAPLTLLCAAFAASLAAAQDIPLGVTYICSGEHIYIENCNIRDLSDNANCMVAHPDKLLANGMNSYTYVTRGALKKLLPTCVQPSAKQMAAAQAFQKKQQDTYNANVKKAEDQLNAANAPVQYGQPQKPVSAEDRAIRRCVTSGRLPASCTGNALLGAFGQMLSSVLPGADKAPAPGPNMAGVFEGAGHWRLDFIDGGVLVNCADLSPNQENYSLDLKSSRPTLTIDTTPGRLSLPSTPMEPSPAPARSPSTASSPAATWAELLAPAPRSRTSSATSMTRPATAWLGTPTTAIPSSRQGEPPAPPSTCLPKAQAWASRPCRRIC